MRHAAAMARWKTRRKVLVKLNNSQDRLFLRAELQAAASPVLGLSLTVLVAFIRNSHGANVALRG